MNCLILLTLVAGVFVHYSTAHPTAKEDELAALQNAWARMNAHVDPEETSESLLAEQQQDGAIQRDPEVVNEQNNLQGEEFVHEMKKDKSEKQCFNTKGIIILC